MKHDCHTDQQGRRSCTCSGLITKNSDNSSPNSETRDAVEVGMDFALFALVLASFTFFLFAAIGFFWSK